MRHSTGINFPGSVLAEDTLDQQAQIAYTPCKEEPLSNHLPNLLFHPQNSVNTIQRIVIALPTYSSMYSWEALLQILTEKQPRSPSNPKE